MMGCEANILPSLGTSTEAIVNQVIEDFKKEGCAKTGPVILRFFIGVFVVTWWSMKILEGEGGESQKIIKNTLQLNDTLDRPVCSQFG
jgi:hypothetical protein